MILSGIEWHLATLILFSVSVTACYKSGETLHESVPVEPIRAPQDSQAVQEPSQETETTVSADTGEEVPPLLAILPMGKFPVSEIGIIEESVQKHYGWRVEILGSVTHPTSAWYEPRQRYRAERILDWISPRRPTGAAQIMAVTEKDISTTKGKYKDWGICGLAELGGTASVVSTYRIKKGLKRFPKKKRRDFYLRRLSDLVAHEFGHNRGLPHCPNRGCIMEDAKGTVRTFDHSTGILCATCRMLLKQKQDEAK